MIILLTGFILFLFTASLLKSNGYELYIFQIFAEIPYYDKVGHFVLMGILGFLLISVISPILSKKLSAAVSMIIPIFLLIILIGVEEYSQQFLSNRSCSWADFWFGVLGIIVATLMYAWSSRRAEIF